MATAADGQLRLDVETQSTTAQERPKPADLVAAMLEAYRGDYRAAIEALLEDTDFLRDQLHTASCLMSSGMGRGWRPKYERTRS